MSYQMTFTFEGFVAYLERVRGRARRPDLNSTLRFVSDKATESVDRSYQLSRSPEGIIFKPVKRTDRGGPPLVLLGDMRKMSLGATRAMLVVGTVYYAYLPEPRYAPIHQHGTARIAKRRFFGIDDQAADEIAGGLADQHVYYMLDWG